MLANMSSVILVLVLFDVHLLSVGRWLYLSAGLFYLLTVGGTDKLVMDAWFGLHLARNLLEGQVARIVLMSPGFPVSNGPLARYVNCGLRLRRECWECLPSHRVFAIPDMHHGTCVTHVSWFMPGSLTSGFLWNRWWGKFPAFPVHVQPTILSISKEAYLGLYW